MLLSTPFQIDPVVASPGEAIGFSQAAIPTPALPDPFHEVLIRLDSEPAGALASLAAVAGSAGPPEPIAQRVRSPPAWAETAQSLATLRGFPAPVPTRLPPDLDRALSSLGQAVLGAERLVEEGDAASGATLLLAALDMAAPTLRRHSLLLERPPSSTPLPAAEVPRLGETPALSLLLLELYVRLGVPVDASTAADVEGADALPREIGEPLASALADLLLAFEFRDAAFAALSPDEALLLDDGDAVGRALSADSPSDADLAHLGAWLAAADKVDRDALGRGLAALARAASTLAASDVRAAPEDVIFQDPFGFVLVTGTGSSTVDENVGGIVLAAPIPTVDGPDVPARDTARSVADALDEAGGDVTLWASVSPTVRAWLDFAATADSLEPTSVEVVVNPGGLQVLRWDLGGSDTHRGNAGGAGNRGALEVRGDGGLSAISPDAFRTPLPVALLVDVAGDDSYDTRADDSLASARAGLAFLLDVAGDDRYAAAGNRSLGAASLFGAAVLADHAGNDTYRGAGRAVGYAESGGVVMLADAAGADEYSGLDATVAASDLGAFASLADLAGDDRYVGGNRSIAWSRGGVATVWDAGGNDTYEAAGTASRGRGDAPGSAVLVDLAGGDEPRCGDDGASAAFLSLALGALAPPSACLAPRVEVGEPGRDLPPVDVDTGPVAFDVPGLFRLGLDSDDDVADPYLLSVDLGGDDVYRVGAVAASPRAPLGVAGDLGRLSPVSLFVDLGGSNTIAPPAGAGAAGFAAGGVAVHASIRGVGGIAENDVGALTLGAGAATEGGVAVFLSDGFRTKAGAVAEACRLACARRGGIALAHLTGGPGDSVFAAPGTLGAADRAGGVAAYVRRAGADVFSGSRDAMGVLVGGDSEGVGPVVAVFVKDGWARDVYDEVQTSPSGPRTPRGNERVWDDAAAVDEVRLAGPSRVVFARGVDNLDWYLQSSLADADRGLAPRAGPTVALPATGPAGTIQQTVRVPLTGPGNGWATGGDGARPVSAARTGLSPVINVESMGTTAASSQRPVRDFANVTFAPVLLKARIRNPPAHADETLSGSLAAGQPLRDGSTIQRVELFVEGLHPAWKGCPSETRRDARHPSACLVVRWDRDVDPFDRTTASTSDYIRRSPTPSPLGLGTDWTLFDVVWTPTAGDAVRPWYPPGDYLLTIRAYAARPGGADALNYTDDAYGLYGAAYDLRIPVLMQPSFRGVVVRDAGGPAGALELAARASEPIRWRGDVFAAKSRSALDPTNTVADLTRRVRALPWSQSESVAGNGSYGSLGYEPVVVAWDGRDDAGAMAPPGRYHLILQVVGALSGRSWADAPLPDYAVFVDSEAPDSAIDITLTTTDVTESSSPEGVIELAIRHEPEATKDRFRSPPFPTAAPVGVPVHLWVQEDVLDAADPDVVLESRPWRHVEVEKLSPRAAPDGSFTYDLIEFRAETRPGPPRLYRFAAYTVDRAGNVVAADPEEEAPAGPDCRPECAVVRYDITPPRTQLELLSPAPEIGRFRGEVLRLRLDASATPDVSSAELSVAFAGPDGEPGPFAPTAFDVGEDGAIEWRPGAPLASGERVFLLSRGIDRVGNVESKAAYDLVVEVDREAPEASGVQIAAAARSIVAVVELDERALLAARLEGPDGPFRATAGPSLRPLLRFDGLVPGAEYRLLVEAADEIGNSAEIDLGVVSTTTAYDLAVEAAAPIVSGRAAIRWTALAAPPGETEYDVALSLDLGASFPFSLTPTPLRVAEPGNVTRAVALDARGIESSQALVRIVATSRADPRLRAEALLGPFAIDGLPPIVDAAAGPGIDSWTNRTVRLLAEARDGVSGVAAVEWSRDGASFFEVAAPLTVEEAGSVWLRARDQAGNVGDPHRVEILFDAHEPALAAQATRGGPTRADSMDIVVEASDSGAGLARLVATAGMVQVEALPASLAGGRAVLSVPLGAGDGSREIRVEARDRAGNSESVTVRVHVDRTPPTVRVAVGKESPGMVRMELDESAEVEATIATSDGERVVAGKGYAREHSLALPALRPGELARVSVVARDAAGNEGRAEGTFRGLAGARAERRDIGLHAEPSADGFVHLTWIRLAGDREPAVYDVERAAEGGWRPIGRTTEPYFVDTHPPAPSARYRVVAIDSRGMRWAAEEIEAPVRSPPSIGPVEVRVRSAPEGWIASVDLVAGDRDGVPPRVRFVLGGVAHDVGVVAGEGPSSWRYRADVRVASLGLADSARAWHVEASDGVLASREPVLGERVLPPPDGELATASVLFGARTVPFAGATVVAIAVFLGWRWRTRRSAP